MLETRNRHTRYLQRNVLFLSFLRFVNRNRLIHELLKSCRIWNRYSQVSILDGQFYYRICYSGPMEGLVAESSKL